MDRCPENVRTEIDEFLASIEAAQEEADRHLLELARDGFSMASDQWVKASLTGVI